MKTTTARTIQTVTNEEFNRLQVSRIANAIRGAFSYVVENAGQLPYGVPLGFCGLKGRARRYAVTSTTCGCADFRYTLQWIRGPQGQRPECKHQRLFRARFPELWEGIPDPARQGDPFRAEEFAPQPPQPTFCPIPDCDEDRCEALADHEGDAIDPQDDPRRTLAEVALAESVARGRAARAEMWD